MWRKKKKKVLGTIFGKICKENVQCHKKDQENFFVVVRVLQTTQYLVILRCCFAEKYNDPKRTCRAFFSVH